MRVNEARPVRYVARQIAGAIGEARARFTARWLLWLGAIVVVALVPLVDSNSLQIASLATGLYIVLAAVGLNYAIGLAAIPSLGQGGFVGIGAFVAAWLAVRWGWDLVAATAAGTAAATVAGFFVGAGAARLTRVYIAITTWVAAWMLQFALTDSPQISGGSQGLPMPVARLSVLGASARFTPAWHYETALLLVLLALGLYAAVKRSPAGLHLAALRQNEPAALVLGADRRRLRTGAVVASAAIGGVAGALMVQLSGIADPTAYGPLLSVKLFVAVIVGGAAFTLGPVVGALSLALVGPVARGLGNAAGLAPERFEPLVAAALLLVAVVAGGEGVLPRLRSLFSRRSETVDPGVARIALTPRSETHNLGPAVLDARAIKKSFGGVHALDGVDLTVSAGAVHAVIGPNGSGKSTLLKILSGSLSPDSGTLTVGDRSVSGWSVADARAQGVVRTLQRTAIFEDMSVREHVLAGGLTDRTAAGVGRHLLATPAARTFDKALRLDADRILTDVGLDRVAALPASRLSGAQQRFLMVAMALATHPSVVLLDEPGAGMSAELVGGLIDLIHALSSAGIAVVLVEHNLRLVRQTASEVTVLSSGRAIAHGHPRDVSESPEVR
ncbi:MAG: ATP-binding cassette domain-containing protein, partial [Actinomycetota bacterium]